MEENKGKDPAAGEAGEKPLSMTQAQLDAVIEKRIARTKEQFKDYDDLKKFKTEAETKQNELTQKQLEETRNYEEAKKTLAKQLAEREEIIKQKDQSITGLKISHALSGEISKQNGYVEEAMALLNNNAVVDANGEIRIKGKDSNGIDTMLTVEQGVKQFLEARPHLVKANNRTGANTSSSTTSGSNAGALDRMTLNKELASAMASNDLKRVGEVKKQLRALK